MPGTPGSPLLRKPHCFCGFCARLRDANVPDANEIVGEAMGPVTDVSPEMFASIGDSVEFRIHR
jgi:hypothetical protein